jgi:hypothetical protein
MNKFIYSIFFVTFFCFVNASENCNMSAFFELHGDPALEAQMQYEGAVKFHKEAILAFMLYSKGTNVELKQKIKGLKQSLIKLWLVSNIYRAPEELASNPFAVTDYLKSQGFNIYVLMTKYPELFAQNSIEHNIIPKLKYFKSKLSLNEQEVILLLESEPQLFDLSIEHIEEQLQWLEKFSFNWTPFKDIILKNPHLLNDPNKEKIEKNIKLLNSFGLYQVQIGILLSNGYFLENLNFEMTLQRIKDFSNEWNFSVYETGLAEFILAIGPDGLRLETRLNEYNWMWEKFSTLKNNVKELTYKQKISLLKYGTEEMVLQFFREKKMIRPYIYSFKKLKSEEINKIAIFTNQNDILIEMDNHFKNSSRPL